MPLTVSLRRPRGPVEVEMIGVPLGLLASNAGEWVIHKYVLHERGRSKSSFWAFHWNEHHNAVRRNGMVDPAYSQPLFRAWDAQTKEAVALLVGAAVWLPFVRRAPSFVGAVWLSMWRYYRLHKRSHLDPEWARTHLPWHYEHHMGMDQNANWCVTFPLFDVLLGTRRRSLGTEAHRRAERKREEARPRVIDVKAQR